MLMNGTTRLMNWRMASDPWDDNQQHEKHDPDKDPHLQGRILLPPDPS
jgi:hypothetical protein